MILLHKLTLNMTVGWNVGKSLTVKDLPSSGQETP